MDTIKKKVLLLFILMWALFAGAQNPQWAVPLYLSHGSDLSSASTLTLNSSGNSFDVTGTTTIDSISSFGIVGSIISLQFDAALTLTHSVDIVLPGGSNITTAAGDVFILEEYATGQWRVISYALASGEAINGTAINGTTDNGVLTYINSSGELQVESGLTFDGDVLSSTFENATTNTNVELASFNRNTSGTANDGIGGYIQIDVEDNVGGNHPMRLNHVLADADNGLGSDFNSVVFITATNSNTDDSPFLALGGDKAYSGDISIPQNSNKVGADNTFGSGFNQLFGSYIDATGVSYAYGFGNNINLDADGTTAIGRRLTAAQQGAIIMGYHSSTQTNNISDSFKLMWDGTTGFHVGNTLGTVITNNSDPDTNLTDAVEGSLAWDSTDDEYRYYDGSAWAAFGGTTIANDANNRITTAVGDGTLNAEANLSFDGSNLYLGSAANNDYFDITDNTIAAYDGNNLVARFESGSPNRIRTDAVVSLTTNTDLTLAGSGTGGVSIADHLIVNQLTASLTDGAPTDAELDTATGSTPAGVGAGYQVSIKDNDGTGLVYFVISDGSSWYYFTGVAAL